MTETRSGRPRRSMLVSLLLAGVAWVAGAATAAPLALTPAEQSWLAAHPVIRIGVDPAWAPYEFVDRGRYRGLAADYMDLISRRLGVRFEVARGLSWPQVMAAARERRIDLLPAVMATPERQAYLRFTRPYLNFPMVVITRADGPGVRTLHELAGLRVGVVAGYVAADLLARDHPAIALQPLGSLREGLTALATGGLDAFVDNLAPVSHAIADAGLTNLTVAFETPYGYPLAVAVRDDWPELAAILDKALASIDDAERRAITERWLLLRVKEGYSIAQVTAIVLGVLATLLLATGGVFLVNRRLRREVAERSAAEQALWREKETARKYLDVASVMLLAFDREGRVTLINRKGNELLGYADGELLGCDWFATCLSADVAPAVRAYFGSIVAGEAGLPERYENEVRTRDGRSRRVSWRHAVIRDDSGRIDAVLASGEDVTERDQAEQELLLAASVFENTHEAIVITDAQTRVLRVNRGFTEITGYTEADARGRTPGELLRSQHHDGPFYQAMWMALAENGQWQGEIWNRRQNGEVFAAWQTISAVRDRDGALVQYISVFSDITEQKTAERRIRHLAHYDVLTDLPNRMLFNDRLQHALDRSRRNGRHLALLFIDLDRFKNVNDTLGHPTGDRLLVEVAARLRDTLREEDTIARLGGDEFTVILEDIEQSEDAALVAQKVIAVLTRPVDLDGHSVVAGASIGISLFPSDGEDAETLLRNADVAMYRAKGQGRNTFQFYTPELTRETRERFDTENALRQAIEERQLVLHYQPQVNAVSGELVGAEALVRWQHPTLGVVPPDRFIPLAEETGLIEPLGRWVLETACHQARRWLDDGLRLRMGVNISGFEISRGSVLGAVGHALRVSGLPPDLLELEIVETFVMTDPVRSVATLQALRELGVTIAIDDFGTGHSSLSYLKRLPIQRIKIDRSFVKDIHQDEEDRQIVAAITAMAQGLRLETIAEGVESADHLAFLVRHGCGEVQGYHISRPVPAETFEQLPLVKAARAVAAV